MTAYSPQHAFDVAPGDPQPTVFTPVAEFFRRLVRPWRREKAAPAGVCPAGAATDSPRVHIPADRFFTESQAWAELRFGEPVLGDRMLSEVRPEHGRRRDDTMPAGFPATPAQMAEHANAMHAMAARYLPAPPRPVNGRNLGTQPRQSPVPFTELNRKFSDGRPSDALLRQVLEGLKTL
jgi:hypothetical protein